MGLTRLCFIESNHTSYFKIDGANVFLQLEPEEAMETVDEGRMERMASGGASSQQNQSDTKEKSEPRGAGQLVTSSIFHSLSGPMRSILYAGYD